MPGPKPKPTRLKMISGNPGGKPLNTNEPQPVSFLTNVAPDWMTESQSELWAAAVESCPPKLLSSMDAGTLVTYVVAADIHRQAAVAQAELDRKMAADAEERGENPPPPLTVLTPNGLLQQSPYVGILNKQSQVMVRAAAEMGFTPSSRSRISLPSGTAPGNEFDGF